MAQKACQFTWQRKWENENTFENVYFRNPIHLNCPPGYYSALVYNRSQYCCSIDFNGTSSNPFHTCFIGCFIGTFFVTWCWLFKTIAFPDSICSSTSRAISILFIYFHNAEKNGFISVCTVNFTVSMPSNIKALNGAQLMCIVFQTNID